MVSLFWILVVVVTSVVIWKACDPFSDAAHYLGRHIPESVRGATIDAVGSSLPELFSTFLFLMVYDQYASGVATCAGSAIYNMLVIPGLCALTIKRLEVGPEVVRRDGFYYLGSQAVLVVFLATGKLTWYMGLTLILLYGGYVTWLYIDARRFRKATVLDASQSMIIRREEAHSHRWSGRELTTRRAWTILAISAAIVGVACHFMVTSCVKLAEAWKVAPYFVAVILAAAATSVPDTFLSLRSTMKGDDSGAVSNAFGSNIFDINICLGLPLLVHTLMTGRPIELPGRGITELWVILTAYSAVTLAIFGTKYRIGKLKAAAMMALYLAFIAYAVIRGVTTDVTFV